MKTFEVGVPISGYQIYRVEADTEEEAKEKVANGESASDACDIDNDTDTNSWIVEEV